MTITIHHKKQTKLFRLKLALILTAVGMIIEFIGGLLSNSLALVSDAGHMLTHLFALGTSYFAIILSFKPVTKTRTYGFYRAEVLAAFINGIFLILVSAYLIYDSVLRFISPQQIKVGEMLLVAAIGLVVNGISAFLLSTEREHDLNIKSAFLHEISDLASSFAVVIAGIIIFYTKNPIADPILSFFISILIIIWAARLLKDSANILLEAAPKHIDIDKIILALKKISGINEIHHVHVWTISSSLYAMTAHVVVNDCKLSKTKKVLQKINKLVAEKFHIEHTNIQFECAIR